MKEGRDGRGEGWKKGVMEDRRAEAESNGKWNGFGKGGIKEVEREEGSRRRAVEVARKCGGQGWKRGGLWEARDGRGEVFGRGGFMDGFEGRGTGMYIIVLFWK